MRKWLEMVKDWPTISTNFDYHVQVVSVRRKGKQIEVSFKFLGSDQFGRQMSEVLELPIRPAGVTASFFAACGQDVQAGKSLSPRDCLGQTVAVRFGKQNEIWRVINFEIWKNKESRLDESEPAK